MEDNSVEKELIQTLLEYNAFLGEAYNKIYSIAHIHHYREKDECIAKGIELRAKIEKLQSLLNSDKGVQESDTTGLNQGYIPCSQINQSANRYTDEDIEKTAEKYARIEWGVGQNEHLPEESRTKECVDISKEDYIAGFKAALSIK